MNVLSGPDGEKKDEKSSDDVTVQNIHDGTSDKPVHDAQPSKDL